MLVLIFFQAWTFYLGTTDVTFERLLGSKPYKEIEKISLRRYKKGIISPHLFTIKTKDEASVIHKLIRDCRIEKIAYENLPKEVQETDSEMLAVIHASPYVYLSKHYDVQVPKSGRMCVLFKDRENLYLFINGNV